MSDSKRAKVNDFLHGKSSFLTRTKVFQKLSDKVFDKCSGGNERVNPGEAYAGILMLHLKLSKYAGPAACYPPSREAVDALFAAADDDKSGYVDRAEFKQITMACCVDITWRVTAYYTLLMVGVPLLADFVADSIMPHINDAVFDKLGDTGDSWYSAAQRALPWGKFGTKFVSVMTLHMIMPGIFDMIDQYSTHVADKIVADSKRKAE
jgi:hypothetical protein